MLTVVCLEVVNPIRQPCRSPVSGANGPEKLSLSGERMIIGEFVITNADQRTSLLIDGSGPVLREKAIMTAERADTPAKRISFAVQTMYTAVTLAPPLMSTSR